MRRVVFNTWSGAFFNPGGGEVQLKNTQLKLETMGHKIDLFNQWMPQRDCEIFHQFSIQYGVEYPMELYRQLGKKVALSTILWAQFPKGSDSYHYVRKIFELADILLTNSHLESRLLSESYDIDIEKFHRTVNGVSDDYLSLDVREDFCSKFNITGDFILTVGNIDRRKNTRMLVEACEGMGLPLVVVGHIRDPDYYSEFSSGFKNVRFLGPVSDVNLLKSAYQRCAVFALPSLCETPGIAALEAASQGAKVVITGEGAAPEYFGDFVSYVKPSSACEVRSALEVELSKTRDAEALRQHVTSKYNWSVAAEQVYAAYSKVL